jgi:hypothetical protein
MLRYVFWYKLTDVSEVFPPTALMMEAVIASESSDSLYETTRRNIPEEVIFNQLTKWNTVRLEKLIVAQIVKKLPVFYGNRIFIVHKRPPMVHILRKINRVHNFRLIFLRSMLILSPICA